ncbi:hypothetical protein LP420_15835 [Massilia sp. B-10]|nr:hypothetical protein LP420_15835 [Massilia sp. B-10]
MTPLPENERSLAEARFMLIEGEAKWLFGELVAARALADQALMEFDAQGDAVGSADAHWLRAWIEVDRGNSSLCDAELGVAPAPRAPLHDALRTDVMDAAAALFDSFCDLQAVA